MRETERHRMTHSGRDRERHTVGETERGDERKLERDRDIQRRRQR